MTPGDHEGIYRHPTVACVTHVYVLERSVVGIKEIRLSLSQQAVKSALCGCSGREDFHVKSMQMSHANCSQRHPLMRYRHANTRPAIYATNSGGGVLGGMTEQTQGAWWQSAWGLLRLCHMKCRDGARHKGSWYGGKQWAVRPQSLHLTMKGVRWAGVGGWGGKLGVLAPTGRSRIKHCDTERRTEKN